MNLSEKINPNESNGISIITQFQPIISVKKKRIIGIEALSRGYDAKTRRTIPRWSFFHRRQKTWAA